MARDFDGDEATEATTVTETDEATEATASSDEATEPEAASADEATSEATEEPTTETKPAEEVDTSAEDMAAFEAYLGDAIIKHDGRDATTGELPAALVKEVLGAYNKLKATRLRNAARTKLAKTMQGHLIKNEFVEARSFLIILNAIEENGTRAPETAVKAPVDPTQAHVDQVALFLVAANLVTPGEGVAEDWKKLLNEKVSGLKANIDALIAWKAANLDKEEAEREPMPEIDPLVAAADRLSSGRSPARRASGAPRQRSSSGSTGVGHSGPKRDVSAHIASAFADKADGDFMLIAEIVKHTSEEYGDDHPSPGAVAARLFPGNDPAKCKLTFVKPAYDADGKKGAIKVAA